MTNVENKVTYKTPVHGGGKVLKPLTLEFSILIPEKVKEETILELAKLIEDTAYKSDNLFLVLPILRHDAERLGFEIEFSLNGSFFDPAKLLYSTGYWLVNKLFNTMGVEKYKKTYNLN